MQKLTHHKDEHRDQGRARREANLGALDLMYAAKLAPGTFSPPYYVNNEEVTPLKLSLVSKTRQWNQCWDLDSDMYLNFGSRRYTIIAFSPVLTMFYYTGSKTTKCGGMVICQTDNPDRQALAFTDFFNTNDSFSLVDLYESDGASISANGFIWASHLQMSLSGPTFTRSGTVNHY